MPAPARIVQEEVVGPTLGAQSIQQGLISFVIAFVVLMIYMILMYDIIPGMMANVALLANLFFTLGILASFQSALTMPGIAGIVLTLGTAVDANVLIYERIKEEMRGGKGIKGGPGGRLQERLLRHLRLQPHLAHHGYHPARHGYGSDPWFRHHVDHRSVLLVLHRRLPDPHRL